MKPAVSMSSPSKFQSLENLLQIKKDNYLGARGKDYCPFEVETLIVEKKQKLADAQVIAINKWERTFQNYQSHNASDLCPPPPKVNEKPVIKFILEY